MWFRFALNCVSPPCDCSRSSTWSACACLYNMALLSVKTEMSWQSEQHLLLRTCAEWWYSSHRCALQNALISMVVELSCGKRIFIRHCMQSIFSKVIDVETEQSIRRPSNSASHHYAPPCSTRRYFSGAGARALTPTCANQQYSLVNTVGIMLACQLRTTINEECQPFLLWENDQPYTENGLLWLDMS